MTEWEKICKCDDIAEEDLLGFSREGLTYVIYRSHNNEYYCTDGFCTHAQVPLEDGNVFEYVIECPLHGAQFDYRTGKVLCGPACTPLDTYPTKLKDENVLVCFNKTNLKK